MIENNEHISGVEFTYYFLCHRKLYLFANNITFEHTNEDVKIGKIIEENHYKRASKSKGVGDINMDKIDFRKGIVYEVKKSSKHKALDQWQGRYYLYYLQQYRGLTLNKAVIQYPEERLTLTCTLNDKEIKEIESIVGAIEDIKKGGLPPVMNKALCKKCAYYEFCYI